MGKSHISVDFFDVIFCIGKSIGKFITLIGNVIMWGKLDAYVASCLKEGRI